MHLKFCTHLKAEDYSHLENLERLEELNFRDGIFLETVEPICKILQKTCRMRKLNLSGAYFKSKCKYDVLNLDAVATQLKNSCPDLEELDLSGSNITSLGIIALAGCKNLRKLNLSEVYVYMYYIFF